MFRTYLVAGVIALFVSSSAVADDVYEPQPGQSGKDVVWIPTPDDLVVKMLQMTKVTKDDLVYDLGSGDGKIPIAAAKQFGATAIGIEYNADMAELARRNVKRAGVDNKVKIITGDIFEEDFTKATVVTMYLLPALNLKLRPTILKMKPGTRVTSHAFNMGDWDPDERFSADGREGFLWYVPANVEGTWTLREEGSGPWQGSVTFTQKFQRVGGTANIGGKSQPLLSPMLQGDQLTFSFVDGDGSMRTAKVTVADKSFKGDLSQQGRNTTVVGTKR